jgi:hypothetical protein
MEEGKREDLTKERKGQSEIKCEKERKEGKFVNKCATR